MIITIFFLLVLYQIKHLLADYFWQGHYMLGKFQDNRWVLPLAAHCGVHAVCTFALVYAFRQSLLLALGLACFDFVVHFIMDRIKAGKKYLGRFKALTGPEYVEAYKLGGEYNPDISPGAATFVAAAMGMARLPPERIGEMIAMHKAEREAYQKLRSNAWFWRSLGIDQMVHHLTHYAIILAIVLS